MKQTFGRVSQRGLMVTSFNGDHIGPITRSVRDSALMLQAIAGYDPLEPSTVPVPVPDFSSRIGQELRGLKMGIPANYYFDIMEPAVETTVRQAISALEGLGVEAREVTLPSMQYAGALRIAAMADSVVTHEPYLAAHRQDYGPTVLYRTLAGQFVLGRDYSKSLKVQRIIKEEYARVLQDVDFLVTPSSPVAAWRIDAESIVLDGHSYPVRGPGSGMTARCTSPSNATGLPAMSIPCGFTSAGLPIGLQLIGRPFEEALLFQVAHGYEAISPSRDRRPALVEAD
jgi:aspartyl-tRNA(Asn)/glutamyl-tRNA(Gln) amidotransferase subunit A